MYYDTFSLVMEPNNKYRKFLSLYKHCMQSINWAMWIVYNNILGCLEKWIKDECSGNIKRQKDM